ncbi:MAG TPA: hypothetical protein VFZ73_11240 [Gemmatimonadaceae bacterium]
MRMRMPLLAGVLSLVSAAPVYACTFYFTSAYMPIPARPTFGAGVMAEFSDPAGFAVSGDVGMKLGERMVVRPAIGLCSYEVVDRENDPFFGAGVALNLTQSATMSLNLQSGISYMSTDFGNTTIVPIGAAASFRGSGPVSFYAGASLWWQQIEVDGGGSDSETDPVLFGGLTGSAGSLGWTLGGQLYMGDDTEFGLVAGLNFNQAASMIRNLPKLFSK